MGTCPECDENFDLSDDAEIWDVVECPKCHVRLEILNVFPVTLDFATEEEET